MAGLAVRAPRPPRLMRQLRKKIPLLLWMVLIIPPVIAVVPFAIGVASDGFTAALTAALLVPNIITQFVAVVLLNLRLKCITTLANHRWGQRILYYLKLISVYYWFLVSQRPRNSLQWSYYLAAYRIRRS